MTDPSKQVALIKSISEGVHASVQPELKQLTEQMAKLQVSLGAVSAKLEAIEGMVSGGAAAKRQTRAAPGAKAATGGKKKGEAAFPANSMLYFKDLLRDDVDGARATWGTEDKVDQAAHAPSVSKISEAKEPEKYWAAVAAELWKSVLTDQEKKDIKAQYEDAKQSHQRDTAAPQLDEENADE